MLGNQHLCSLIDSIPKVKVINQALDGTFRTIRITHHALDIFSFFDEIQQAFDAVMNHLSSDNFNVKLWFSLCTTMIQTIDSQFENFDSIHLSIKTMKLI